MHVHIIELSVPHKVDIEAANEKKQRSYEELVEDLEGTGWTVGYFFVEVSCRGYVGTSVRRWLSKVGCNPRKPALVECTTQIQTLFVGSLLVRELMETAQQASHWIWNKKEDNNWQEDMCQV